jgi:hypothetical protein
MQTAPNTGPIGLFPDDDSFPGPPVPLIPPGPRAADPLSGPLIGEFASLSNGPEGVPGAPTPGLPTTNGQSDDAPSALDFPQGVPLSSVDSSSPPQLPPTSASMPLSGAPGAPPPVRLELGAQPSSPTWGSHPSFGSEPGEQFPFLDSRRPLIPGAPNVPRPAQASPPSGPITQPTLMLRPYELTPMGSASPPETGREVSVDNQPDDDETTDPGPSLVRPYSRTGGRTKPGRDLALEALVSTTVSGRDAWHSPLLTPEHTSVIELCSGTVSVAEIAARLAVPLGVARVIIADMVDLGLVEVMKTSASAGDERDPAFLRRVLSGLQRL